MDKPRKTMAAIKGASLDTRLQNKILPDPKL